MLWALNEGSQLTVRVLWRSINYREWRFAMKDKVADNKISIRELFFIMLSLFLPFEYGISLMEKQYGSVGFLLLALAVLFGVAICFLYYYWYNNFGNLSFGEIFGKTFGKIIGKIILAVYLLAFWAIIIDFAYALAYVWGVTVNTEPLHMLLLILFVAVTMSFAGKTVIGRLANLVVFPSLILVLLGIFIMLGGGSMGNLSAIGLADSLKVLFPSTYGFAITFGLAVLALPFFNDLVVDCGEMDFAKGKIKEKKLRQCLLMSVIIGGTVLALLMLRNLAVLGSAMADYELPLVQILKMLFLGNSFNRVEILGVLVFEAIGITGLAFAFCSLGRVTAALAPIKGRVFLLVSWGLLTYLAAFILLAQPPNMVKMLMGCTNSAVWLTAVIIPLVTLLTDKIRKH